MVSLWLREILNGNEITVVPHDTTEGARIYWFKHGFIYGFSRLLGLTQYSKNVLTPETLAELLANAEINDTHAIYCRP